jgi:starch phosphorylase
MQLKHKIQSREELNMVSPENQPNTVAYFSMEIGINAKIPTYSGGLGVLAGDTLRSLADLGLPTVAISLLYRKGYFNQVIDQQGQQGEKAVMWDPASHMELLPNRVHVMIGGRKVSVQAWLYKMVGVRGDVLPIFFLDTDIEGNGKDDRALSHVLYGGDSAYRLAQEIVLGEGGVNLLADLGYEFSQKADGSKANINTFHMNEGHSALLTLALLKKKMANRKLSTMGEEDKQWVRDLCVFTTHTPVPAGHDQFDPELATEMLGEEVFAVLEKIGACPEENLNMSYLALNFSRYINGVAKRHGEVSREMFPAFAINAITNGVHAQTWTAPPFQKLFDCYAAGWREDNFYLRNAIEIPNDDLWQAHKAAKGLLFDYMAKHAGVKFDPDVFTIGFARRAAEYKRADLLFTDIKRLEEIASRHGKIQIVFAGKAHPKDLGGKALIKSVVGKGKELDKEKIQLVYLENYDMDLGALITSGVDIWLNNPVKPLEASGTSGMKANLNGVPNFSTLDGWWVEGHYEGVTGWVIEDEENAFGQDRAKGAFTEETAENLYQKLDKTILPLYKNDRPQWAQMMRDCISINGSFFNTHRMMLQYKDLAYKF